MLDRVVALTARFSAGVLFGSTLWAYVYASIQKSGWLQPGDWLYDYKAQSSSLWSNFWFDLTILGLFSGLGILAFSLTLLLVFILKRLLRPSDKPIDSRKMT